MNAEAPAKLSYVVLLAIVINLLVAIVLYQSADTHQQRFEERQTELAEHALHNAAREISLWLGEIRRTADQLAASNSRQLTLLYRNPDDQPLFHSIEAISHQYFAHVHGLRVVDKDDTALQQSFKAYRRTGNASPGSDAQRFYSIKIPQIAPQEHQLIIDLSLKTVRQQLVSAQPPMQQLYLLYRHMPLQVSIDTIEHTSANAEHQLTQEEQQRILARRPIADSPWELAALRQEGLFEMQWRNKLIEIATIILALAVITTTMMSLIRREERAKAVMGQRLQHLNSELEEIVTERTHALQASMEHLESEAEKRISVERELRLFRTLMEQSSDAILVIDAGNAQILDANARSLQYLASDLQILQTLQATQLFPDIIGHGHWHAWVRRVRESDGLLLEGLCHPPKAPQLPIELSAQFTRESERDYIVAVMRDIRERVQNREELERRDRIRAAICFSAESLLRPGVWDKSIEAVMGQLGHAARASRVYLYEVTHDQEQRKTATRRAYWCEPKLNVQQAPTQLDLSSEALQRWGQLLRHEERMVADPLKHCPPAERAWLRERQIQSFLLMPIHVGGIWWGFIGFDDCRHERQWSEYELDALKAAARALSAAIARHRTDEELRLSARFFESTSEAVMITDADKHIIAVNPAFCRITGFMESEVHGQTPSVLQSGEHGPDFYQAMHASLKEHGFWRGELRNRRKNGELFPVWENISEVRNEHGHLTNYVSVFSDISLIEESQRQLEHLAHFDTLTGLPNRLLFKARLKHALELARRFQQSMAILLLDLDRFKMINDSLGHPIGDKILLQCAERIRNVVRHSDTVARLGGDEFILILENVDNDIAGHQAQQILNALREPFSIDGQSIILSASIGISLYPDDGPDADIMMKHADSAMYKAKEEGRNIYRFYTEEITQRVMQRFSMESQLHQALENEEFVVYYQPQYDSNSQRITGVEALVRWQPHGHQPISPDEFLEVAEESGLIRPIGAWVLNHACSQAQQWLEYLPEDFTIAVNVSAKQIEHDELLPLVHEALRDSRLPPKHLELELTESLLLQQQNVGQTLNSLHELGIQLAIDDFGTGYSNLAYLKHYPIDSLKIDRMFVEDMCNNSDDAAIVRAAIGMAQTLGRSVTAEGVETEEQARYLDELGCHVLQGYYFARPMPADEMTELLKLAS